MATTYIPPVSTIVTKEITRKEAAALEKKGVSVRQFQASGKQERFFLETCSVSGWRSITHYFRAYF